MQTAGHLGELSVSDPGFPAPSPRLRPEGWRRTRAHQQLCVQIEALVRIRTDPQLKIK